MSEKYTVRVSKSSLGFSAGHFITFGGGTCERLHGHDFRVAVEVDGPLDEDHCVVDFILLGDALESILDELDHRMLLPGEHPAIRVTANEREVEAVFEDRRWVFPRSDCVILPVANTTCELLARYLGERLLDEMEVRCGKRPSRLRLEIAEGVGQSAICRFGEG